MIRESDDGNASYRSVTHIRLWKLDLHYGLHTKEDTFTFSILSPTQKSLYSFIIRNIHPLYPYHFKVTSMRHVIWRSPLFSSHLLSQFVQHFDWSLCRFTGEHRTCLNLCSYNYLGFAENEGPVIDAVEKSIRELSFGTGSPRLEAGVYLQLWPSLPPLTSTTQYKNSFSFFLPSFTFPKKELCLF